MTNDSLNINKIDPELVKMIEKRLKSANLTYLIGTVLGILVGMFFCLGGFYIILSGVSGSIEWFFKAGSIQSKLSNASPGIIAVVAGVVIICRYKPKIKDILKAKSGSMQHVHIKYSDEEDD